MHVIDACRPTGWVEQHLLLKFFSTSKHIEVQFIALVPYALAIITFSGITIPNLMITFLLMTFKREIFSCKVSFKAIQVV